MFHALRGQFQTRRLPEQMIRFASGRAEDSRSFSQKNSLCEFFCEKDKQVPCCRRRSGLQVWHQAETSTTA
jgi:hypothetical protein